MMLLLLSSGTVIIVIVDVDGIWWNHSPVSDTPIRPFVHPIRIISRPNSTISRCTFSTGMDGANVCNLVIKLRSAIPIPTLILTTSRASHSKMIVKYAELPSDSYKKISRWTEGRNPKCFG
jgi:hypothetical protein